MKRIIALIICVFMFASLFTACAQKSADQTPQNGEGAAVAKDTDIGKAATDSNMSSGGRKPRNGKTWKIGYSNFSLVYNSFTCLETTLSKLCKEAGYEYQATDAQGDIMKQISDIEDLSLDSDIIMVNTLDPDTLVETINDVAEMGIPVIALNGTINPDANILTTIQSDNYTNGVLVGQWIANKLPAGKIRAVILSGDKVNEVGRVRRNSMIEGIMEERLLKEGKCDLEIVAQVYTDWLPEKSAAAMEDILARNVDFDVLISEADVMAMEAMKVLRDAGRKDVLVAASADAQKEALELIKNGEYGATGLNSFVELANIAAETCAKWIEGETKFPPITYTPSACITIDNVDKYYDPDAIF